ncbi:MAG: hypothetical protein AAF394_14470, partial [Planctomycetota bacterium]
MATSNITRIRLPAGIYSLRLERPGFNVAQQEITVSWGSQREVKADWQPNAALRTQRTLIEFLNTWPAMVGRTAYDPLVGQLRTRIRQFRNQDLSRLHQAITERLERSLPNTADLRSIDFPEQSILPNTWTLSEQVYRHAGPVSAIQFDAEGKLLATAGLDGRVCLWNMSDGGLVAKRQSDSGVTAMRFLRSTVLALGEANGRVITWNFIQNNEFQYESQRAGVTSMACSANGAWLAVGAADYKLRIYRSGFAEPKQTVPFTHQVGAVAWSEDQKTCAANDANGITKLVSIDESKPTELAKGPPAKQLYFTSQDSLVALGKNRQRFEWSLNSQDEPKTRAQYSPLAIALDNSWQLQINQRAGKLALEIPETGFSLSLADEPITGSYSPNTELIALGYRSGEVEVYSRETGELQFAAKPDSEFWTALAISSDHSKLATGAKSGRVVVWDLFERRQIDEFQPHQDEVQFLAFASGDKRIISHARETLTFTNASQTSESQSLRASLPIACRTRTNEVAFRRDSSIVVRNTDTEKEVQIPIQS